MTDLTLHKWKFTPVANPDDAWWQGRKIWTDLVVEARTSGEAQLRAEQIFFADAMKREPVVGQDKIVRGGFDDPRLYRVDRIDDGASGAAFQDGARKAAP